MSEAVQPIKTDRRTLLKWSIGGLLTAFFAATVNVVVRYLLPPPPAVKVQSLTIPAGQVPVGGGMAVKYKGNPVILIHTEEGFAAFSSVCTHLGCVVKWITADKIFYCPCHAGKFDTAGKVLSGPPPEPLRRIKIEVRDNSIIFL